MKWSNVMFVVLFNQLVCKISALACKLTSEPASFEYSKKISFLA